MNRWSQKLSLGQSPLWKRILQRHKFRDRLLRARVPLVLRRLWSPRDVRGQMPSQRIVSPQPLSLHIQLSWPQWLVNVYGPTIGLENSIFKSSVTTKLHWLTRKAKDRNTTATLQSKPITGSSSDAGRNPNSIRSSLQEQKQLAARHAVPGRLLGPYQTTHRTTPRLLAEVVPNPPHTSFNNRAFLSPVASTNVAEPAKTFRRVPAGGESWPRASEAASVRHVRRNGIQLALKPKVEPFDDFGAAVHRRFVHRAQTDEDNKMSSRSKLYSQPAWLNFANDATATSNERVRPQEQAPPSRPPTTVQPAQPQFDIGRLSEEVYRHIQRKVRVERERRGQ